MTKRIVKSLKVIIILIVVFFILIIFSYNRGINSPASDERKEVFFTINKGESVNQISENLFAAGLIKSKTYFEYYVWLNNVESKLQAGSYSFNTRYSIVELVDSLVGGRALSDEREIKIIEGWTNQNIEDYLLENNIKAGEEFGEKINDQKFIAKISSEYPELKFKNLEGYLFPDTYRIYNNSTAEDVIVKMIDNLDRKLTSEMRNEIKKQNKSISEIIIMASIVEKEVRSYEDMRIVSGIFWDRIKYGQALESDATLSYFLGDKKAGHSIEELETDTPYNSYKYRGLPPGPVSNPGLNAIQSAIYPEYTDYNYFLNRQDTGETIFSVTYDEHLRNKAKYLK